MENFNENDYDINNPEQKVDYLKKHEINPEISFLRDKSICNKEPGCKDEIVNLHEIDNDVNKLKGMHEKLKEDNDNCLFQVSCLPNAIFVEPVCEELPSKVYDHKVSNIENNLEELKGDEKHTYHVVGDELIVIDVPGSEKELLIAIDNGGEEMKVENNTILLHDLQGIIPGCIKSESVEVMLGVHDSDKVINKCNYDQKEMKYDDNNILNLALPCMNNDIKERECDDKAGKINDNYREESKGDDHNSTDQLSLNEIIDINEDEIDDNTLKESKCDDEESTNSISIDKSDDFNGKRYKEGIEKITNVCDEKPVDIISKDKSITTKETESDEKNTKVDENYLKEVKDIGNNKIIGANETEHQNQMKKNKSEGSEIICDRDISKDDNNYLECVSEGESINIKKQDCEDKIESVHDVNKLSSKHDELVVDIEKSLSNISNPTNVSFTEPEFVEQKQLMEIKHFEVSEFGNGAEIKKDYNDIEDPAITDGGIGFNVTCDKDQMNKYCGSGQKEDELKNYVERSNDDIGTPINLQTALKANIKEQTSENQMKNENENYQEVVNLKGNVDEFKMETSVSESKDEQREVTKDTYVHVEDHNYKGRGDLSVNDLAPIGDRLCDDRNSIERNPNGCETEIVGNDQKYVGSIEDRDKNRNATLKHNLTSLTNEVHNAESGATNQVIFEKAKVSAAEVQNHERPGIHEDKSTLGLFYRVKYCIRDLFSRKYWFLVSIVPTGFYLIFFVFHIAVKGLVKLLTKKYTKYDQGSINSFIRDLRYFVKLWKYILDIKTKPSILVNTAETCYMNSMMQALAACPVTINELKAFMKTIPPNKKLREFIYLLKTINDPSDDIGATKLLQSFVSSVKWNRDSQQDAFQLLSFFINNIHREIGKQKIMPPKCRLLHTFTESSSFNKVQDHLAYAIPLCGNFRTEPGETITTLLDAFFAPSEIDDGHFSTSVCVYDTAPNVLILHIQANEWSSEEGVYIKPRYFIQYGSKLEYMFKVQKEVNGSKCVDTMVTYELMAVVKHMGEVAGGHYITYRRNGKTWYLTNDEQVEEIQFNYDVVPYIMLYQKIKEKPV